MTPWGFVKHGWIKDELKGSCPLLQLVPLWRRKKVFVAGCGSVGASQIREQKPPSLPLRLQEQSLCCRQGESFVVLVYISWNQRWGALVPLKEAYWAPKIQDPSTTFSIPNCASSQSLICNEKYDNSWFVLKCMSRFYDQMTICQSVPHIETMSHILTGSAGCALF